MAQIITKSAKGLYELWKGRVAILKHFKVFGRQCYVKVNEDKIWKLEAKANKGIFLGYAYQRKGYICYKKGHEKLLKVNM